MTGKEPIPELAQATKKELPEPTQKTKIALPELAQETRNVLPELAKETKKVLAESTQETKIALPELAQETEKALPELAQEGEDRTGQDRLEQFGPGVYIIPPIHISFHDNFTLKLGKFNIFRGVNNYKAFLLQICVTKFTKSCKI